MGYRTEFKGILRFGCDLNISELKIINEYLNKDIKDFQFNGGYIDLKITDDFSGLKFNDAEKSYNMSEQIKYLIDCIKKECSRFVLNGEFEAQGEDYDDRYIIRVTNNKIETILIGLPDNEILIKCPCCYDTFVYNTKTKESKC